MDRLSLLFYDYDQEIAGENENRLIMMAILKANFPKILHNFFLQKKFKINYSTFLDI
jgi:hypothetical protein